MPFRVRTLVASCLVGLCSATFLPGQSGARSVAPGSGKALCSALTPADFTRAGVSVAALKEANLDGPQGAYCVYSSNAGKVEFDIFFPAGASAAEVNATEKTVLGEGGAKFQPAQLTGADDAQISLSMPDLPNSAGIVVRKGRAVFDIVVPRGTNARQQLLALAQAVLVRLKQ